MKGAECLRDHSLLVADDAESYTGQLRKYLAQKGMKVTVWGDVPKDMAKLLQERRIESALVHIPTRNYDEAGVNEYATNILQAFSVVQGHLGLLEGGSVSESTLEIYHKLKREGVPTTRKMPDYVMEMLINFFRP
jgi:hypothetical protein